MSVNLLYVDDAVVAVDKPAGIVVHPGWAQDEGGLVRQVRALLGKPAHPVHRLDRSASGVVLFALSSEAARRLGEAFAQGRVDKRYFALVRGQPPADALIDHPIPAREGGARVPARTWVRGLGAGMAPWQRYGLCEARPLTGRLHQIRRHLKHIACPIIGDVNYGKGDHNRRFREEFGLHRLALHAFALGFVHPVTGTAMTITAAPSGELATCLERLGFAGAIAAALSDSTREQAARVGRDEADAAAQGRHVGLIAGGDEDRGAGEDALPAGDVGGAFEEQ
ncbi:MAG TPA: pseudouridine synthase [Polyangia bacterium]